jgi:hypothetical protein
VCPGRGFGGQKQTVPRCAEGGCGNSFAAARCREGSQRVAGRGHSALQGGVTARCREGSQRTGAEVDCVQCAREHSSLTHGAGRVRSTNQQRGGERRNRAQERGEVAAPASLPCTDGVSRRPLSSFMREKLMMPLSPSMRERLMRRNRKTLLSLGLDLGRTSNKALLQAWHGLQQHGPISTRCAQHGSRATSTTHTETRSPSGSQSQRRPRRRAGVERTDTVG